MVPSRTDKVNMRDKGGLYLNLFDDHPPFQIGGNFGATSRITEMPLQSHLRNGKADFFQDLLQELPSVFPAGKVSGIKERERFDFS